MNPIGLPNTTSFIHEATLAHPTPMRIWDIPPEKLCRNHLLGEHRELHAIWSILTQKKKGYSGHPEVKRWRGKLKALYLRHEQLVKEMQKRGFKHSSPLAAVLATGSAKQDKYLQSYREQTRILKGKKCDCDVQDSET